MGWLRGLVAFVAAVVFMAAAGTIAQTVSNLIALGAVGASIAAPDAASMILFDLIGLGPLYGAFIAVGFAVALFAGFLIVRFTPLPRTLVYAAAGFACMGVMLLAMEQAYYGVQMIAGARFFWGFAAQLVLGALAGVLFARLAAPEAPAR